MKKFPEFLRKYQNQIRFIWLILFVVLILYLSFQYSPKIGKLFQERDTLREEIQSRGAPGVLLFILIQILQIVVAAIPGEAVQIAGGYLFGSLWGTVYLMIGALIGSAVVFAISRLLGYEFVKTIVPEKTMEKFFFRDDGKKFIVFSFILFLIPGIPKDVLTYIAGLTPVKPLKFLMVAVIGRFPALLASTIIGDVVENQEYKTAIIISAVAVVMFLLGVLFREKLMERIHSIIDKTDHVK